MRGGSLRSPAGNKPYQTQPEVMKGEIGISHTKIESGSMFCKDGSAPSFNLLTVKKPTFNGSTRLVQYLYPNHSNNEPSDVCIISQMQQQEEEEHKGNGGNYATLMPDTHFLWAGASAAQLGWAVVLYWKGFGGHSTSMPFRAFAVASLFVSAGATAAFASLRASGIHKGEDLIQLGANIRTGLGVQRRPRDE